MGGLGLPYNGTLRNREDLVNHASTSTNSESLAGPSKSHSSAFDSSSTATYVSEDFNSSNPSSDFDTFDAQRSRDSVHGRFQGTVQQLDPLAVMKEVLDKLFEDGVPGPQLLRLHTEFSLELGRGTQFRVTTASRQHRLMLQRAHDNVSETQLKRAIALMLDSVIKRAHWIPENVPRGVLGRETNQELSGESLRRELHNQLRSAKAEIDKLCKRAIKKHRNIVELRGWGLCLDTFEDVTPLNTRIPLLLLERATCNLGDFLASSAYDHTGYTDLYQICADIGAGLSGLHQGNIAHGDMKPENVLLFRCDTKSGPAWTAKLCDFGSAESKPDQILNGETRHTDKNLQKKTTQSCFEYSGTPGWTPPEDLKHLDFEGLKLCDIFAYGLVLWRVFDNDKVRGYFDIKTQRRMRNIAAPIDEENMPAYRKKDRAYMQAADAIRKSNIIPAIDVNRILKVLRAALQPVPEFRDLRPWKFFNKVYYPKIDYVDERPGQHRERGIIWAAYAIKSSLLPSFEHLARKISITTEPLLDMTRNYSGSLKDSIRPLLPELRRRSQEQQVFEEIFYEYSDAFGLGADTNSLQVVGYDNSVPCPHSDRAFLLGLGPDPHSKYHLALESFRYELERFCVMPSTEPVHDRRNAYARIRSRLKLCCGDGPITDYRVPIRRPLNCLELTLDIVLKENQTTTMLPQGRMLAGHTSEDQIFSAIAWLCRGEIGRYELGTLSSPEKIWHLPCETRLVPNLRTNLFLLFMQNGCFIGDEFESKTMNQSLRFGGVSPKKTAFRHFLEMMIEGSQDVGFRSDWIAQVCTNIVSFNPNNLGISRDNKKVRFFFRGENPEDAIGNSESGNDFIDTFSTTILHEAVLASCYTAVKYLADSGFPLSVWNYNRCTALDHANTYAKYKGALEPWRQVNNNLILGLLSKKRGRQSSGVDLPLGWEELQSEYGAKLYLESTVNPDNPSLTFRTPQFSLLQERRIAIGSRKYADSGQEYRFDLVRFIQRPKLETAQQSVLRFDDEWYKRDVIRIKAISAAEISPYEDERPWIRFPARVAREFKIIILRDYSSILLPFIPLSIAARGNSWDTQVSLVLSAASLVGLARTWDINLADIYPNSIPSNLGQSVISAVGGCSVELIVRLRSRLDKKRMTDECP